MYEELGDISLDVPLAHSLLERLVELCFDRGIITKALRDACPARYRHRSWGDTGGAAPLPLSSSSSSAGAGSAS